MKFHLEGLTRKQIEVMNQIGQPMQERGFYLTGGTALSIYYGHRFSLDLDWFIPGPMGDALVLAEWIRGAGLDFVTEQTGPGTLHGTIQGVRVTFLEYRYPLLQPLTKWGKLGIPLASLDDLACMKLSAVAQRGLRKDFCDIYFLGMKHRPLQDLLRLYLRKFKVKDTSPVLYGLSYFDDAEGEPMPHLLLKVQWKTIKKTIQNWVMELGKGIGLT
jgi:Nucleotidyl transferase AbiEii toxin, Type IV TA system